MDSKIAGDSSGNSHADAVNVRRRALLGGSTTAGIAVASIGAMAMLSSERADASGDPGGTMCTTQ